MKEKLPNKNLESFFQKTFESLGNEPADDGWDLPSDKVWGGIEAQVGTPQRRINWWTLSTILLLLLLFLQYFCFQSQMTRLEEVVVKNESQIEQLSTVSAEKTTDNSIINKSPATSDSTTSLKSSSDRNPKSPSNLNKETSKEATQNTKLKTQNAQISQLQKEVKQLKETISALTDRNTDLNQTLSEKDATIEILTESINSISNPVTEEKSPFVTTPLSQLGISSIPLPTGDLQLTLSEPDNDKKSKFIATAWASPIFASRIVKNKNTGQVKEFGHNERSTSSFATGLHLGFNATKRFRVLSGLQYSSLNLSSDHMKGLRYSQVDADVEEDGKVLINDYDADLETAAGDVDVQFRISNELQNDGNDFNEGGAFPVTFTLEQKLDYLSVPLLLEYQISKKRFGLSLQGGMAASFLINKEVDITDVEFDTQRLKIRRINLKKRKILRKINDFNWDLQFALAFNYKLTPHLSATVQPWFQYNLSPMFESARLETRAYSYGLRAGMQYKF